MGSRLKKNSARLMRIANAQSNISGCGDMGPVLKRAEKSVHNDDASIGNDFGRHDQRNEGHQNDEQIRRRASQCDQVVVARNLFEVARDHRRGLGPADQHSAEKSESEERAEDDDGWK